MVENETLWFPITISIKIEFIFQGKKPLEASNTNENEIRPPFSARVDLADKDGVGKAPGAEISSHFQLNPLFVN